METTRFGSGMSYIKIEKKSYSISREILDRRRMKRIEDGNR